LLARIGLDKVSIALNREIATMTTMTTQGLRHSLLVGAALAAVLAGASTGSLAADQAIDLSSGSASFIGTGPLLNGGDDLITFTNTAAGSFDFLLSMSSQNILDLGATLNGRVADVFSVNQFRFVGLSGTDDSPFSLLITGTAGRGALYSGELSITAAVPEAQTYALMLVGLGAVAFATKRRRVRAAQLAA
jgi:hypothetical protein